MLLSRVFLNDLGACLEARVAFRTQYGRDGTRTLDETIQGAIDWDDPEVDNWVSWLNDLKTNPQALKYDGQYHYLDEWKVAYNGTEELFTSRLEANQWIKNSVAPDYRRDALTKMRPVLVKPPRNNKPGLRYISVDSPKHRNELYIYQITTKRTRYRIVGWTNAGIFARKLMNGRINRNKNVYSLYRKLIHDVDGYEAWDVINYNAKLPIPTEEEIKTNLVGRRNTSTIKLIKRK